MRRITRGVVVVCLLVGPVSMVAASNERDEPRGFVRKTVKRVVRALGDLITVPIPAPAPKP